MANKSVYFPIVFHFHQPVDNFGWVFDESYEKSYGPLIDQIFKHEKVKVTLHFTGSLLEWLLDNKPEFKEKLTKMVARKQCEIIGGGYYEPIFAIIPERDRIAQMKMLKDSVKEKLGYITKGAWLSERVWEPHYPSFLSKVGLNYVIVDDNHLKSCGLSEEDTFYCYTTEDEGNKITVFPINETIRYLSPWRPAFETIKYLESNADDSGERIILFLSDAEKMGVWGTTYDLCYVKGHGQENEIPYIEAFLSGIENSKIIESITLSEYLSKHDSKGLLYIPNASYDKMEEWVLPTPTRIDMENLKELIEKDSKKSSETQIFPRSIKRFIKGGFWRYFLVKYPESNNMHKKMLYTRKRLIEVEEEVNALNLEEREITVEVKRNIERAWDEIYKSQCNDCYWHGQFGGVYLHFLRHAVYSHLIIADKIIDEIEKGLLLKPEFSIETLDFDKDSKSELIVRTDKLFIGIKNSDGGTIFQLDYKPRNYNLLNTLTRWYEAYHKDGKKIGKDGIIDDKSVVINDRWRKSALRDHLISEKVTLEEYIGEKYEDYGDFVDNSYISSIEDTENGCNITLLRTGLLQTKFGEIKIKLQKVLNIISDSHELNVEYNLSLIDDIASDHVEALSEIKLAIDFPFIFSGDPNTFKCTINNENNEFFSDCEIKFNKLSLEDPLYELRFDLEELNNEEAEKKSLNAFKYQISCYAQTNNGYKEVYEGMNLVLCYNLKEILNKKIGFKIRLN